MEAFASSDTRLFSSDACFNFLLAMYILLDDGSSTEQSFFTSMHAGSYSFSNSLRMASSN